MAKAILDDLSGVPEGLRDQYVQREDGKYVLQLEDADQHPDLAAAAARAAEKQAEAKFRDRNIAQAKELEAAQARLKAFEGIDPAKYRELDQKEKALAASGVGRAEDVAAIVARQVAEAQRPLLEKIAQSEERERAKSQRLAQKETEAALRDAAAKAGVADSAVPDFISRGMRIFKYEGDEERGGAVVAKNGDDLIFSKKNAGKPLSPEEWAKDLRGEAPHLFKPSSGGGAGGGTGNGAGGTREVGGDAKVIEADVTDLPLVIGRNLEDIASGKVRVALPNQE